MSILSQIIAYSPNKIDTEKKAQALAIGPRAMVGEITDEQTQFGRPIYQTPAGEKVSEKSTTLFLNGDWMNVPSIHGGKPFNEDELRLMIKQGNLQPTSVHKSKADAEAAAKARSDSMVQGPRNMYAGGRIGFYEGKLVTAGPNKGKYVVYNVPESISKTRTKFFPNKTSMNKWIESRPGQGRKDFGKFETGSRFKGTIQKHNLEKVKKLEEVVTKSNSQYKKSLSSKAALEAVGFKDGYQAIQSKGALRDAVKEKLSKLLTTQQKIDNYVNNVMLAEDALVKDFKNPISHIAKKFGVSRVTVGNWARDSQVYQNNKNIFTGLSRELNYNKYKFVGDGVPRLMSDYSVIMQNKLPTSLTMYGGDQPSNFIMQSAYRNYIQNKTAGKNAKITFVGNPELLPQNEWQFIKGNKLYSLDPSVDEIEFNGKTYKNNYLARGDAKTLYANDFGNIYKKFDNLDKYMNTFVPDPNNPGKEIRLDTLLRQKAFNETGKKNFLKRRFVELDHMDILNDPFGNSGENSIRLLDRQTNVRAGIVKRLDKYKNNPKLLNKYLTDIGYFNVDKTNDAFIKRIAKTVSTPSKNEITNSMLEFAGTITDKCKIGNAEGGRIGFKTGSADCLRIAKEGMDKGLSTGKWKSPDQAKMARNIAETAGKIGKTGIGARVMAELFGPVAIASLPVFEAGIAGYDTITSGTPFNEAINKTLLHYALGDKTKADPEKLKQADILKMSDGPEKEMLIGLYSNMGNLNRVMNNYKQKAGLEQDKELYEAVDIMGYGDEGASATQAQKQIEAINNKISQDRAQGKDYMTLSRAVDDPYAKGLAESKEGELLAKRDANSLSSRLFGTTNPYYFSSNYSGEVDPKRIEEMKAKNIGMGDSQLYSRDQIVDFLKTVPDMEVTDETVDFLQTKLNADYFRNVLNQPGMLGTQYSEGGIASLNVKK